LTPDGVFAVGQISAFTVLGVLLKSAYDRFVRRMVRLRWYPVWTQIATTMPPLGGELKILYNGNAVTDLHHVQVTIENESSRDLENLEVDLHFRTNAEFLNSQHQLRSSKKALDLSHKWQTSVQKFISGSDPGLRPFVAKHRPIVVPVLNRGDAIEFNALIQMPPGTVNRVELTCMSKGVRAIEQKPGARFLSATPKESFVIGQIVTIATMVAIGRFLIAGPRTNIAGYLLGMFSFAIGALLVTGYRKAMKIIG
jgi:hypothetical protein